MHGIKPETNLDFLLGHELQEVCLGLYVVTCVFDKNLRISFESQWAIEIPNLQMFYGDIQSHTGPFEKLILLINQKIIKVNIANGSILLLAFSNNMALSLIDNSLYESFQIIGKDVYIVV